MRLFLTQLKNLILRLLSILILFQCCRLFFFLYNVSYFNITSVSEYLSLVYGSLRFDISAILYLNLPLILLSLLPSIKTTRQWYRTTLTFLFITTNLIGILLNIFDTFYNKIIFFFMRKHL